MADNVVNFNSIPIASDELATLNGSAAPTGTQAQRVKVIYGLDGDGTDVSTTNRMPVALSTVPALTTGAAIIGRVGTDQTTPGTSDRVTGASTQAGQTTPTIQNYNVLYTVGDYVGPSGGNAWTINPCNRASALGGQILNITLIDAESLLTNADIWIFDNSNIQTSLPAGNAAWSLSDAAAKYCRDIVSVTDWKSYANGTVGRASLPNGPIPYTPDGQTLYFAIVTQVALTYAAATSLTLKVGMLWD